MTAGHSLERRSLLRGHSGQRRGRDGDLGGHHHHHDHHGDDGHQQDNARYEDEHFTKTNHIQKV